MRIFFLLTYLALFFFVGHAKAQSPVLEFKESVFDFGKVSYADTLTALFKYSIKGEGSLSIKNIKSECACLSGQIQPNEQGKDLNILEIFYMPYKYGSFEKSIEVIYSATGSTDEKVKKLIVKGHVSAPTAITERFLHHLGPLMTKNRILTYGNITTRQPLTKKFELHNPTNKPFTFKAAVKTPPHIKVQFDNSLKIEPSGNLDLFVTYWADEKKDYGNVLDTFWIYPTADMNTKGLPIVVSANIEEYFPSAEESNNYADFPALSMVDSIMDMGDVYSQDSIVAKFVIYNKSQKDLKIYKIVAGYGCKVYSIFKAPYHLAPNESSVLEVHVLKDKMKGKLSRSLTLYCNDPRNHVKLLKVYANLK